jgi:hypothetical protein
MIDVGQILQPFLKQPTYEEKLCTLAKDFCSCASLRIPYNP